MSLTLIDTQLLIWSVRNPERLRPSDRDLIEHATERAFSVVSIWEVAIKAGLRRPDFEFDPERLRQQLGLAGLREIPVLGAHAIAVRDLPPLHKDPFDRMLIAQAAVERATLLTTDRTLARYPGDIRLVR